VSIAAAVSLGLGVALARQPAPVILGVGDTSGFVSVVAREFEDLRSLTAAPETVDIAEYPIRASGVVRGIDCVVGEPIASGTRVATVDAGPVLALRLSRPLWRDLWQGSSGSDISDLQGELRRLGFDVGKDGRYDARVADAVAILWDRAGVSERRTFIARSDIVWLRHKSIVPSECLFELGDEVSPGDMIMRSGGNLTRLRVSIPDTVVSGSRLAIIGDVTALISDDASIEDGAYLAEFAASKAFRTYEADDPNQQLTVETRLAEPIQVVPVPAGSLYSINGATACVVDDSGPLAVNIVASELGETLVSASVLPRQVLLYPDEDATPCR
jgi:hypothetical protein